MRLMFASSLLHCSPADPESSRLTTIYRGARTCCARCTSGWQSWRRSASPCAVNGLRMPVTAEFGSCLRRILTTDSMLTGSASATLPCPSVHTTRNAALLQVEGELQNNGQSLANACPGVMLDMSAGA